MKDYQAGKSWRYLPPWEEWVPPRHPNPRADVPHNVPPISMSSKQPPSRTRQLPVLERPGGLNLVRRDRRPAGWKPPPREG